MPALAHSTHSTLRLLPRQAWAWLGNEITALGPGCFAMVMATGIVSNALFVHGYRKSSGLMFEANALAYVWFAILTRLSLVADFPLLRTISLVMVWISLAAWAATFIGLAISSWRSFRQFTRSVSRQPAAPV